VSTDLLSNDLGPIFSQGLPAPVVGAMAENASLFLAYREFQDLIRRVNHQPLSQKPSLPQLALAAAGAGGITSFLLFVQSSP
jgi:ornithine carrier protein